MCDNECPTGGHRQVPVETFKCSQCNFYTNHEYYLQQHNLSHGLQALMEHHKKNTPTDQEALYKPHVLTHSTPLAVCSYPPFGTENTYMKPNMGLMLPAPQGYECGQDIDAKVVISPTIECPTNFCTYETENGQNSVSLDPSCPEVFKYVLLSMKVPSKCCKCDSSPPQEESIRHHINDHKLEDPSPTEASPKEVYRWIIKVNTHRTY